MAASRSRRPLVTSAGPAVSTFRVHCRLLGELVEAQQQAPIVSVQKLFSLAERGPEAVLEHCEREGIAFIPWFPLAAGQHPRAEAAVRHEATPAQLALAWLLTAPRHLQGRPPGGQRRRSDHLTDRRRGRTAQRPRLTVNGTSGLR